MSLLLKQSPAAVDLVVKTFNMSSGERSFVLSAKTGEGLFFAGRSHVGIAIIASRAEHRLITSNPKEIAKMKAQQAEVSEEEISEGALVFEQGSE